MSSSPHCLPAHCGVQQVYLPVIASGWQVSPVPVQVGRLHVPPQPSLLPHTRPALLQSGMHWQCKTGFVGVTSQICCTLPQMSLPLQVPPQPSSLPQQDTVLPEPSLQSPQLHLGSQHLNRSFWLMHTCGFPSGAGGHAPPQLELHWFHSPQIAVPEQAATQHCAFSTSSPPAHDCVVAHGSTQVPLMQTLPGKQVTSAHRFT
jgi:hypothetical protein